MFFPTLEVKNEEQLFVEDFHEVVLCDVLEKPSGRKCWMVSIRWGHSGGKNSDTYDQSKYGKEAMKDYAQKFWGSTRAGANEKVQSDAQ